MKFAQGQFNYAFNEDKFKVIDFNPDWGNGTGYFDHAVWGEHAPTLEVGEVVNPTDTSGRRIMIVGTPLDNVIMFERYSQSETGERSPVIVFNASDNVSKMLGGTSLGEKEVALIVTGISNIGLFLKDLQEEFKTRTK